MIIGIDGNEVNIEKRVGVGKYGYEVLRQLYKTQNYNLKFEIYLKGEPLSNLPKETDFWRYKIVGPKKFWTQMGLPFNLFFQKPRSDVFFTPSHYAPRFSPCPRVISIMDLSFLRYPEMFKAQDLYQLKSWTAYSVAKAARILTISKSSKNDIIKYYQVPEERVVVTYPGADGIKDMTDKTDVRKKYGIKGDYILSVGTLQPRKNLVRLIEAFSTLDPNSYTLIIVGKKGWLYKEILAAPKKFGVEKKVKFLDYVPDEDLPALYQEAECFVLISLYEGFGLPVLDALKHGVPVVVSNVSSLPEVVGEAGILVDPNNVQDIAKGIDKVINDTAIRQELIKKGKEQAAKFSWEKCGKDTLKVLEEVGGKHV